MGIRWLETHRTIYGHLSSPPQGVYGQTFWCLLYLQRDCRGNLALPNLLSQVELDQTRQAVVSGRMDRRIEGSVQPETETSCCDDQF